MQLDVAGEKQIINQRVTPITEATRKVLLRVIRERPGLGNGPLFPAPRDARMPVEGDTLRSWIRRVEKAAGVPRLPHDSFHGLKRKRATERKHLPDVDVAAAGGWAPINTMKRAYQQADDAGILEVLGGEPETLTGTRSALIEFRRSGLFSRKLELVEDGREITTVKHSWGLLEPRVAFLLERQRIRIRRKGFLRVRQLLQTDDGSTVAEAKQLFTLARVKWTVFTPGGTYMIQSAPRSSLPFSKRYGEWEMLVGVQAVGGFYVEQLWGLRGTASLPDEMPIPVKVFCVYLVVQKHLEGRDGGGGGDGA